jgi:7,8-dihydroneopterin 2',3'-cyclic phosphate phosphodiesterase
LNPKLRVVLNKIKNRSLREKAADFLDNPTIKIGNKLYRGLPLDRSPASISRHHSYSGGLLEHILASSQIALDLCAVVREVYCGKVDSDLVLCGTILHDLFKPLTYIEKADGSYKTSPLAEKIDHLTLIVSELIRRGFPMSVIHVVCAHHGHEAGPVGPHTVEALVCHLADLTDSRLNGDVLSAARYLTKEATGEELEQVSSKEAFEIVYKKAIEGWEGVRRTVEEIRTK